jgi:hypothetical protein
MAAKVFISYRRDDSADSAGRVRDLPERNLGRDLLFMEVDVIWTWTNCVRGSTNDQDNSLRRSRHLCIRTKAGT